MKDYNITLSEMVNIFKPALSKADFIIIGADSDLSRTRNAS
jgi:hypothetical protein